MSMQSLCLPVVLWICEAHDMLRWLRYANANLFIIDQIER